MPPRKKPAGTAKNYKFKRFNWSWVRYDSTIAIFGQRGGGKSNWSLNLLLRNRLPRCFVICESPEIHSKYASIPSVYRHEQYDEEMLQRFLQSQNRISKKLNAQFSEFKKRMQKEMEKKNDDEWNALYKKLCEKGIAENWDEKQSAAHVLHAKKRMAIKWGKAREALKQANKKHWDEMRMPYAVDIYMDDCSSDNSIMKSKLLCCLINNGRHFIARLIVMVQYLVDFPSKLRGGLDWVVIFRESITQNIKKYHQYYAGMFPSVDEFRQILNYMCQNYGCMVINMRASSMKLEDKVFVCNAEELDGTGIDVGTEKYKIFNQMYAKELEEEEGGGKAGGGKNREKKDEEVVLDDDEDLFSSQDDGKDNLNWQDEMRRKIMADIQNKEQEDSKRKNRPGTAGGAPKKPKDTISIDIV